MRRSRRIAFPTGPSCRVPMLSPGRNHPDLATIWFGTELGTIYLQLAPDLGASRRDRWRDALSGAADFLVRNGDMTWYINGNDNLAEALVYYLAWRASGRPAYWADLQKRAPVHPSPAAEPLAGRRVAELPLSGLLLLARERRPAARQQPVTPVLAQGLRNLVLAADLTRRPVTTQSGEHDLDLSAPPSSSGAASSRVRSRREGRAIGACP